MLNTLKKKTKIVELTLQRMMIEVYLFIYLFWVPKTIWVSLMHAFEVDGDRI